MRTSTQSEVRFPRPKIYPKSKVTNFGPDSPLVSKLRALGVNGCYLTPENMERAMAVIYGENKDQYHAVVHKVFIEPRFRGEKPPEQIKNLLAQDIIEMSQRGLLAIAQMLGAPAAPAAPTLRVVR